MPGDLHITLEKLLTRERESFVLASGDYELDNRNWLIMFQVFSHSDQGDYYRVYHLRRHRHDDAGFADGTLKDAARTLRGAYVGGNNLMAVRLGSPGMAGGAIAGAALGHYLPRIKRWTMEHLRSSPANHEYCYVMADFEEFWGPVIVER